MYKQTIIQYTEDETVIQFRWNHSLTVNVYEGFDNFDGGNIIFTEIDVFTFSEETDYYGVGLSCENWLDEWASEMLSRVRPDGTQF